MFHLLIFLNTGMTMLKNRIKKIFFGIGIALLLLISFTLINVLLYKKGYFDEKVFNISYTVICVALLINFLNSYSISKRTIYLSLSLGKTRKSIFDDYLKEMLFTILMILGMYVGQAFITHYIWKDLIFYDINYVYEFVIVLLLTLGLGFIGFILGSYKVNELFTILIIVLLIIVYFLNDIFVFNIANLIYRIIIILCLIIINTTLFIITKRVVLNIKIKD